MGSPEANMATAAIRQIALPLTNNEVQGFSSNGFLTFEQLVAPGELQSLRRTLENLFETRAGENEGAQLDLLAPSGRNSARTSPQITNPANYAPELHQMQFFRDALTVAKQLLGEKARFLWDMAILKAPKVGAPTPWHQDEAYRDPNFEYTELTIWIALQDTPVENGCLRFLPGSHRIGVLEHGSANNDPSCQALQCSSELDPTAGVSCPLHAGDCTVHHHRTLHCSNPNTAPNPRLGYILIFGLPPRPVQTARTFPWLEERHTHAQDLRRQWMWRGGLFVTAWRRLRHREVPDWLSIKYAIKRSLDVLHSGR
jgi:Phytanoyl-CoA dioxygenase (PhyH)